MHYWLMKSEPEVFSIDDLMHRPMQTDSWEGVRNYQVCRMLRHEMQLGDMAFFYHSSCNPPGIAGIMTVVKTGYPDNSAFDPESPYFDPKSNIEHPRWYRVDVKFVRKFDRFITLQELRSYPELEKMLILRKGNRLSITPVDKQHWDFIMLL